MEIVEKGPRIKTANSCRALKHLPEWNSSLENSPKALNYRLYKQIFEFENYFNIVENKDIFTFCKLRTTNTKEKCEFVSLLKASK